ncbi:MAG: hypothetical protein KJS97_00105 [Alphaproteobacteria bacterium]|nr:hypothetical protein [Alphaproteobacteria bacterium]
MATAALAGILTVSLVPSRMEQRAVAMREATMRADTAYANNRPREAMEILRASPESRRPGADYMRAMLRYLGAAGDVDAHFALLHGSFGRYASPRDLRSAIDLYTRRNRPALVVETLRDLVALDAAAPDEMLRLARALADRGDTIGAATLARRLAPGLRPGDTPADGVFLIKALAAAGDVDAARRFAQRWLGPSVATSVVLAVAPAIVEAGHADIAVEVLRPRAQDSPKAQAALDYALRVAASTNPEIRGELTRGLLAARAHATGASRTVIAHDLFAYGDFDLVRATMTRDGSWREPPERDAFIAAMRAHGQAPALRDLLIAEARAGSVEKQRRTARDLAAIGFPAAACAVLAQAAARTGPDSPATQDLLYLWRAHGIAPDTEWLKAQIEGGDDGEAARWVQRFAEATSTDAALALLARLDTARSRPSLAVLRTRFLGWRGPSPELRAVLDAAVRLPLTPGEAGELLSIACAVGDDDAVRALAVTVGPPRTSAARSCRARVALEAAHAAQRRGALDAAVAGYREAASFAPLGSRDLFDFASALEPSSALAAQDMYRLALARLPRPEQPPKPHTEVLRAALLVRLGHPREAQAALEQLVASNADNAELRTVLAEIYVDSGAYRSALALTRPQAPH